MSLIEVIIAIAVLGLLVYIIKKFIPMEPPAGTAINIVFVVLIVLILLKVLFGFGPDIQLLPDSWRGGKLR